jgi:hypothetical protein
MRSNAVSDWDDKTVVNARPAERFIAKERPASKAPHALPTLFDETDNDAEPTAARLTRVHSLPSDLLRAARPVAVPAAQPVPSEAALPPVMVDVNDSEVRRSGVRIQPRTVPPARARRARVTQTRVLLVAVSVLSTLAGLVALVLDH